MWRPMRMTSSSQKSRHFILSVRCEGSLRCPARLENEAESQEMRLRRHLGKIFRVSGFPPGNRGQPRQGQGHSGHVSTSEYPRSPTAEWTPGRAESAEKALPFFKVLKKADQFAWTEECQAAFDKLKQYLHHLPTLASPRPEEKLYLYLSAADEAVSAVLIRDEGTQVPVYYVSRALRGPETRYTQVEKLVLGLVHAARRLKPYFLAHPISLRTDQPLRQILVRPEASGRLTKWAVELGEYDLSYEPRTAIKAQGLADFLAELTFTKGPESTSAFAEVSTPSLWTLYVDGSSNGDGSGAGVLLEGPQGEVCSYALRFGFPATNNEAEYEALIAGLQLARRLGAQQIHVRSDSQLVVRQVLGEYEAKGETMQRYLSKVHQLTGYFESFEIQRIPRSQNKRADALSRLASTSFSDLNKTVLVEVLSEPGYVEEVACPVHSEETWMTLFILFWVTEPSPKTEPRREKYNARRLGTLSAMESCTNAHTSAPG
ncbi:uncharacterized protein [Coffea arabica]|uniref:RNase H type-1 domain-containing protein n=1 Tax=Coffea arabica TaxID=13443 RepID=A0A6P6TW63_COFAR|nr:uncharacterized protein LOC113704923 [Coffea arabica]